MKSEDSDTILLNPSSSTNNAHSTSTAGPERPSPPSRSSTFGIKKCWICICDSTEDDPDNPPVWRSPCKCNLTAHESCLLDWVADLENPRNSKRKPSTKILCPQCRSEIKIARPKSYILEGYRAVDGALARLVLPGIGVSLLGTIWAGAWIHGFQSVYLVFGEEDARRIFQHASKHRGWLSAYSLVPLNLIFARTNYSDFVLPSGTLFLLATQLSDKIEIDMTIWPPLPSTVFACLPAIRSVYNWAYARAFGKLNKKWLAEVQPRQNERIEDQEEVNEPDLENAANADGQGGLIIQLELNLNEEAEAEGAGDQAGAGQDNNDNNNAEGNNGGRQAQNGHVHQILGERGDEIVEGTSSLGQTMLGALAFPAVAASMGGLLTYVLPSSWMTNANFMNGRPGLLRTKWGRSVVGGCLFVVLKDALVLYCRWRLAQGHRRRRVMNYDKQTKRYTL